jgi:hypothetical protein
VKLELKSDASAVSRFQILRMSQVSCPRCLAKADEETKPREKVEVELTLDGIPRNAWPFSLVLRA